MEKLVGTGRSGDFVHANMEMAAKADFRNVAKVDVLRLLNMLLNKLDLDLVLERGLLSQCKNR